MGGGAGGGELGTGLTRALPAPVRSFPFSLAHVGQAVSSHELVDLAFTDADSGRLEGAGTFCAIPVTQASEAWRP